VVKADSRAAARAVAGAPIAPTGARATTTVTATPMGGRPPQEDYGDLPEGGDDFRNQCADGISRAAAAR